MLILHSAGRIVDIEFCVVLKEQEFGTLKEWKRCCIGSGQEEVGCGHLGANDIGKVYSEVLNNRYRRLGKRLKVKGCEVMFSGILPRLGNNIKL